MSFTKKHKGHTDHFKPDFNLVKTILKSGLKWSDLFFSWLGRTIWGLCDEERGMSMILIVDNDDSFTFNLADLIEQLGEQVKVVNQHAVDLQKIADNPPLAIVLSPGPGRPDEATACLDIIRRFKDSIPILGVCLGMQCLAYAAGADVVKAPQVVHGQTSEIQHLEQGIFTGLPTPVTMMRYHSLIVDDQTLCEDYLVTAWCEEKSASGALIHIPMAIKNLYLPIEGVQFHPESIASPMGRNLVKNFLEKIHQKVDKEQK